MSNKGDCLQKGEPVKFQVFTVAQTGQKMACMVVPQRKALVECVKDQVAFVYGPRADPVTSYEIQRSAEMSFL